MSELPWPRVEALFNAALTYPEEQREAFLNSACAAEPGLRDRVAALLAADHLEDCVLDRQVTPPEEPEPASRPTPREPGIERVGPYRLVRELGQGGMSSVWLAVRDDPYRRQVAIKLLQLRLASKDQALRWRMEQQILASLEHPNIARLYDTGVTEEGHGYLVMEYVEGTDIVSYCDRHRLGIKARIELLQTLCHAVSYAHQNLILHRDIKPSNILVSEGGVPKLLDFGIAKILNPHLVEASAPATAPWQRLLTPEFASPEQMQGRAVTTATDVYSLGVLLYELLTGFRPFRFAGRPVVEIERVLMDLPAPRPSSVVEHQDSEQEEAGRDPEKIAHCRRLTPARLARWLRGDLDKIVAVALRKEPHRRYPTVDRLAEDLRRHLEGLPVNARPSTLGYRFGRFLRRNRRWVAASLVLVAAAVGSGVLSLQLARQRERAEAARNQAVGVVSVLERILESSDPQRLGGVTIPAEQLLADGARFAERGLSEHPEIQADLFLRIGRLYRRRGLHQEALPWLERAHAYRAAAMSAEDPAFIESLAELARVRGLVGDLETAEANQLQVLALVKENLGPDHPKTAAAETALALTLEDRGAYAEAEKLIRHAIAVEAASPDVNRATYAATLNQLAGIRLEQGFFSDAAERYTEALATVNENLGETTIEAAQVLNGLGIALKEIGDLAGAEQAMLAALEIQKRRLGGENLDVLSNLNNLGALYWRWQEFAKAQVIYEEALDLAERVLGPDHPNLSFILNGIGRCRTALGDAAGAETPLRRALEIRRDVFPDDHLMVAKSRLFLAASLIAQERFADAEPLLLAAYRIIAEQEPRRERNWRETLSQLVSLYQGWGRAEDAEPYLALLAED